MLTAWYLNNGIDFWNTPDFLRKFSSKQTCHEKFNVILNYHLNKMTQWGNYKFYLWKFQERSQTSWLQRLFPLLFAFPDKLFLVNTSKLPNMPQATKLANSDLKTNTKTDTICICICIKTQMVRAPNLTWNTRPAPDFGSIRPHRVFSPRPPMLKTNKWPKLCLSGDIFSFIFFHEKYQRSLSSQAILEPKVKLEAEWGTLEEWTCHDCC